MTKLVVGLVVAGVLAGQEAGGRGGAYRIGGGVIAPKPKKKPDPHYTQAARDGGIQGNVVLQIVVGENGVPRDIRVLSPLGFGLDEEAIKTVETWRFEPGKLNGNAVPVRANVQVNFRLTNTSGFDERAERKRTQFNSAIANLQPPGAAKNAGRDTLVKLKDEKFPAAQFLVGTWMVDGSYVPKDETAGRALIEEAAKAKHGPALYFLGIRYLSGPEEAINENRGWSMIQEAAIYGSTQAQYSLGARYEYGDGAIGIDNKRAIAYYRQCAVTVADCQYTLGRVLVSDSMDRVEGMAWLELASDNGSAEARALFANETKFTPDEQLAQARAMKKILLTK